MEYRFEVLSDTTIHDLPALFKDAFDEDRSIEQVKNKYSPSYYGGNYFTVIAYDSTNTAAGLYAIFPFTINYNNKPLLIGQVGDILIHSAHRKSSGLFVKLGNFAHENARKNNMQLLFAFVFGTKGSYPVFTRYFDFIDNNDYVGYNVKVNTLPLKRWTLTKHGLNLFYKPYAKLIGKLFFRQHKGFSNYNAPAGYFEIIKDQHYFNYKTGYSNAKILEVKGVRFFIRENKDGSWGIGDIDKCTPEKARSAIRRLKLIAFLSGVRILQFEASKDHFVDTVMSEYSKNENRRLLTLQLAHLPDIHTIKFTFSDLDTY